MNETADQRVTPANPSSPGARLRARLANPSYATFAPVASSTSRTTDTRLAEAPRAVPWSMKLLVLTWSWWALWALFMLAIAPIELWHALWHNGHRALALGIAEGCVVVVALYLMRKSLLRLTLLRRGVVADVRNVDVKGTGTYYSGVTYSNMWVTQAEGWKVTRRISSGPSTRTKITYAVGGDTASLTLHGMPYRNGVILSDPDKPSRALCVNQFPYDLHRDASGNWLGRVSPRVIVGSLCMWAVVIGWTAEVVRLSHHA